MKKYDFCIYTYQSRGEGKVQYTDRRWYIKIDEPDMKYRQTYRNRDHKSKNLVLYSDKNVIGALMVKLFS